MTRSGFLSLLKHPFPALMARFYIGGIFVYASLYKINFPAEFSDNIASYLLVPHWFVNPLAVFLPWMELVSGTCLMAGIRVRASATVICGMLVMFTLALILVLLNNTPIDCGCFKSGGDPVSWFIVIRDLVWLAMGIYVFRFDSLLHLDRVFMIKPEDLDRPASSH